MQHSNPPLVSVIIPTYRRSQMVCEAINSVLNQSYQPIEIIVVDDGSNDDTVATLRKAYGDTITVLEQSNQGNSAARNLGLSIAKGKYIGFLDDDDHYLPHKIKTEVDILEKNQHLAFTYALTNFINADNITVGTQPCIQSDECSFQRLFEGNTIISPTVTLIRKSMLDAVGEYDTDLINSSDYDLWLRISKHFPFTFINDVVANYRVHESGISNRYERRLKCHLLIFQKDEIMQGKSFWQRRLKMAQVYFNIANLYLKRNDAKKAGKLFLQSFFIWPAVGKHYWPKGLKTVKCSLPLRILYPVYMFLICVCKRKTLSNAV